MTIMGILSTFCVAVVALVLDKVLGVKEGEHAFLSDVWKFGQYYIATASALMLISGLVFYRQRSLIARYYGGICLCLSKPDKPENDSLAARERSSCRTAWIGATQKLNANFIPPARNFCGNRRLYRRCKDTSVDAAALFFVLERQAISAKRKYLKVTWSSV